MTEMGGWFAPETMRLVGMALVHFLWQGAAIAAVAPPLLRPAGHLVVEIGAGQQAAVTELFAANGLVSAEARHDLSGIPRALAATVR